MREQATKAALQARKLKACAWAGIGALLSACPAATAIPPADASRAAAGSADGRFQLKLDETAQIEGRPQEEVAAFRTRMNAVVEQLRSMPAVNSPPFPACSRLQSRLSRNDIAPVLAASILVTTPEMMGLGDAPRSPS